MGLGSGKIKKKEDNLFLFTLGLSEIVYNITINCPVNDSKLFFERVIPDRISLRTLCTPNSVNVAVFAHINNSTNREPNKCKYFSQLV